MDATLKKNHNSIAGQTKLTLYQTKYLKNSTQQQIPKTPKHYTTTNPTPKPKNLNTNPNDKQITKSTISQSMQF